MLPAAKLAPEGGDVWFEPGDRCPRCGVELPTRQRVASHQSLWMCQAKQRAKELTEQGYARLGGIRLGEVYGKLVKRFGIELRTEHTVPDQASRFQAWAPEWAVYVVTAEPLDPEARDRALAAGKDDAELRAAIVATYALARDAQSARVRVAYYLQERFG